MKRSLLMMACMLVLSACIKEEEKGADLKMGDMIPDFEVVMNDGTVVSDDVLKESVSVIMFFHTSCDDCQMVLPVMQRIYDEYASKGVSFALISRSDNAKDIEFYWERNGLEMPYSAQIGREVYELFASTRIPRIYINYKGGIIRYIYTDDPVPAYDDIKSSIEDVIR